MTRRHSSSTRTEIFYEFWLVFDDDGGMRFSRGQPALGRSERGMACKATLPRALFSTPTLSAQITIDEGLRSDFRIDITAAAEALSQAIGVDVDLKIREAE